MDIKKRAVALSKMYGTTNPINLAESMGVQVIRENLGGIYGYYNKYARIKQIHINHNLPEHLQRFTAGHELGHAVLHPDTSTPFLRDYTYFSIDRLETEANRFAVELLIPDDEFNSYCADYTLEQIARIYGYHERLIELKLK